MSLVDELVCLDIVLCTMLSKRSSRVEMLWRLELNELS
jgi:hypothetical protein